ncbi:MULTISPECIES: DsrE/DsrF/TusD sulfur relay family protein [unclassified Paludibacterium]|uniref:DsrE/DsrF/TusD sulfur relay family protein n=1 Tax=unclassified Paludibacterium TaxID=2618429 RepID=UPI001C0529A4|nr:DsrE family protein [Paludibacterium sp. B53371]BEV70524.1 DsrE/DsrF/TusD sulfur relay family protein [Paludibacterium sp. THUN1379]
MQNILFTLNASPYGSERTLSGLRLALALSDSEAKPKITLFLLSDAVVTAMQGQTVAAGATLGEMLQDLLATGATVKVCRTCTTARGIDEALLIKGVGIGTMPELAELTLAADKVLSF